MAPKNNIYTVFPRFPVFGPAKKLPQGGSIDDAGPIPGAAGKVWYII